MSCVLYGEVHLSDKLLITRTCTVSVTQNFTSQTSSVQMVCVERASCVLKLLCVYL